MFIAQKLGYILAPFTTRVAEVCPNQTLYEMIERPSCFNPRSTTEKRRHQTIIMRRNVPPYVQDDNAT